MLHRLYPLLIVSTYLLCAPLSAGSSVAPVGKRVLKPFDYKGVTLDSGRMRMQVDEVGDYYLRIPNDDLLKGFRERAGQDAPGADLGGWYSRDEFHNFGQIISGLSRIYAATGNRAYVEKVNALIAGWRSCIEKDGYFYYSRKPNAPHYVFDKMVCGLVDAYLYCNNREALACLGIISDYARRNLEPKGPHSFSSTEGPGEWYTLSENLYRAYVATGDVSYRDSARLWEYTDYWNNYATKSDIFSKAKSLHAYSHVNSLSGAGAAYLVTGEKRYLDALMNAYDYLQQHQCYATGGYGPIEYLAPPGELPDRLYDFGSSFETQCGSWAAFKMAKYLLSFTGDARYGDWIERLVINGIGASIPASPDGSVFYYSNYRVGRGIKKNVSPWSCCSGTRVQAIADYYDLVYMQSADGICVTLFTPSTVSWKHGGSTVTLKQQTRFPEEDKVRLTVSTSRPARFALRVRVPEWLSKPMAASINGKPVNYGTDKHWAVFERTWTSGDQLLIELPMAFRTERFPRSSDRKFPLAILRGPVVLALRSQASNPSPLVDYADLNACLIPCPGEPLTYRLAADHSVLLRPFYAYKAGEPYFMYLDPQFPFISVDHFELTYKPDWFNIGVFHVSGEPGATMEHTFEGAGIQWTGFRYRDAGKAEISIDGEVVDTVDMYGPNPAEPFAWQRKLPRGKHTIVIKVLEDKNPESTGRCVNIRRLEIM